MFVSAEKLLSTPKTPSHSICCQSSHQVPNSMRKMLPETEPACGISMSQAMQTDTFKLVLKTLKPQDLNIDPSYLTTGDMGFSIRGFYQQVGKQFSFVLDTPNDGGKEPRI